MRSSNWSTPAQNELADEAIRLIPAIAAARIRESHEDIHSLYEVYADRAIELKVPAGLAWKIFGVSSVAWSSDLVRYYASNESLSIEDAAMHLIARAMEFTDG